MEKRWSILIDEQFITYATTQEEAIKELREQVLYALERELKDLQPEEEEPKD